MLSVYFINKELLQNKEKIKEFLKIPDSNIGVSTTSKFEMLYYFLIKNNQDTKILEDSLKILEDSFKEVFVDSQIETVKENLKKSKKSFDIEKFLQDKAGKKIARIKTLQSNEGIDEYSKDLFFDFFTTLSNNDLRRAVIKIKPLKKRIEIKKLMILLSQNQIHPEYARRQFYILMEDDFDFDLSNFFKILNNSFQKEINQTKIYFNRLGIEFDKKAVFLYTKQRKNLNGKFSWYNNQISISPRSKKLSEVITILHEALHLQFDQKYPNIFEEEKGFQLDRELLEGEKKEVKLMALKFKELSDVFLNLCDFSEIYYPIGQQFELIIDINELGYQEDQINEEIIVRMVSTISAMIENVIMKPSIIKKISSECISVFKEKSLDLTKFDALLRKFKDSKDLPIKLIPKNRNLFRPEFGKRKILNPNAEPFYLPQIKKEEIQQNQSSEQNQYEQVYNPYSKEQSLTQYNKDVGMDKKGGNFVKKLMEKYKLNDNSSKVNKNENQLVDNL